MHNHDPKTAPKRSRSRQSGDERSGLVSTRSDAGVSVQHIFVARLVELDLSTRTGPEFEDASRGGYDVERVDLRGDELAEIDLKPLALKEFILANREALLSEVTAPGA
jgi:hypothetical protein